MTILEVDLDAPPVYLPEEGEDDPDASHIVTQAALIHSQLTGEPIEALCGKVWIPRRNPDDYPLCQRCLELLKAL